MAGVSGGFGVGRGKKRLEELKLHHPFCCFCGGTTPTETVEHAPPKAFFKDKNRLKGLEFPACRRCNNGSSQLDQVASLLCLAMSDALNNNIDQDYIERLIRGVRNNTPEVLDYLSGPAQKDIVRIRGLFLNTMRVTFDRRLMTEWLNPWAAKQAYALWYEHSKSILDENSSVFTCWLTNDKLIRSGIPSKLFDIATEPGFLIQGSKTSSEQFFYRYSANFDIGIGLFAIGAQNSALAIALVVKDEFINDLNDNVNQFSKFKSDAERGIYICPTE